MAEKAKILILSTAYLPHIGGSELAIKNITDRLPNFDFDLITGQLDKNSPEYERMGNVSVFRAGGWFSLLNLILPKVFLPLAIFFKAKPLIAKNNYTLIHAYQASQAAGAAWLLKFFYPKLPLVVTLQEGKDFNNQSIFIKFFRRLIIKKTDAATVISEYLKKNLLKVRGNLPVEIISNGVDTENFSRQFSYGESANLENSLGIKPDDKVIVSVSRLAWKNGLDLLIEAFYVLNSKFKIQNSKLLIIGDGPLRESLKFKVKSLKLENSVIFAGLIGQEKLPIYLNISDVFIRPSRSEGLGSAFLEAMAARVPIIGPKIGGIPDFLKDHQTGLFCLLNPDDIAFKLHIIFENQELRRSIIDNAYRLIKEKYDWSEIAGQFERLYNKVV